MSRRRDAVHGSKVKMALGPGESLGADTVMGSSNRVDALTGLRFFAAAAIVLTHSQTGYFFQPGTFAPFDLSGAVPLFFVLSGFVLTVNSAKYASHADFLVALIGTRLACAHGGDRLPLRDLLALELGARPGSGAARSTRDQLHAAPGVVA